MAHWSAFCSSLKTNSKLFLTPTAKCSNFQLNSKSTLQLTRRRSFKLINSSATIPIMQNADHFSLNALKNLIKPKTIRLITLLA